MKIVNMILTIIMVISIPVAIICLANNLTNRMPDLYQYEFKSSEVIQALSIEEDEDELGIFFSEFMMGKTEKFQIVYKFGDNTDELFTYDEQDTMKKFIMLNNRLLYYGLVAFFVSLIIYFLLFKQNLKKMIRGAFIKSAMVFTVLIGAITVATYIPYLMDLQYEFLFNYEIKAFLTLPQLLTKSFFVHSAQATVVISSIAMLVLWSFTWRITKPRRIFGSSR